MRTYATPADLNGAPWRAGLDPETAEDLLARATPLLEELTRTASYTITEQGLPVHPLIIEAFKDAACAQALWFVETGDPSGAAGRFNSIALGSFSASGGTAGSVNNQTAAAQRFAPEAVQILANAGLIAQPPRGA